MYQNTADFCRRAVADPGGERAMAPGPVKINHKKDGGRIDFMFLDPPPSRWIRY